MVKLIEAGAKRSLPEFYAVNMVHHEMYQRLGRVLEDHDTLICQTPAIPSITADHRDDDPTSEINGTSAWPYLGWTLTYAFNLVGPCPVASVPAWLLPRTPGFPPGLQIVGRTFDDMTVFRAAASFEKARPWWDKRPLVGEAATKEAGAVA